MTLNDILISALSQLGRGHDTQSLESCRSRLTRFANDAQSDLADAVGLFRTDKVLAKGGMLDLSKLTRVCRKVLKIAQHGHSVPFRSGDSTNQILLPYDTSAAITYRYEPKPLVDPTDVSELDEGLHGLIVTYVVGRERMAGDVATQSGSNLYLAMYESAKQRLRKHKGTQDAYTIINRY